MDRKLELANAATAGAAMPCTADATLPSAAQLTWQECKSEDASESYPLDETATATLKKWAGQEWTPKEVERTIQTLGPRVGSRVLAEAHKAAITAEREKYKRYRQLVNEEFAVMRQPQEWTPELVRDRWAAYGWSGLADKINADIAVGREKLKQAHEALAARDAFAKRLERQLAAMRQPRDCGDTERLLNEILDHQIANRGTRDAFYRCYTYSEQKMPPWVRKAERKLAAMSQARQEVKK